MTEPQPTEPIPSPTAAEKASEANALSNLSTQTFSEEENKSNNNTADSAALGAAVSNLSLSNDGKEGKEGKDGEEKGKREGEGEEGKKGAEEDLTGRAAEWWVEKRKGDLDRGRIKVRGVDVEYLVTNLEISKKKATELLQLYNNERMEALKGYVVPGYVQV